MPIPVLDSKIHRRIITVSTSYTLSATSVGETSGSFYANGVLLGAASNPSGDTWTYNYTPGSVAASISITFVGAVNGTSEASIVTVTRADTISRNIASGSGWSSSWMSRNISSKTHPDGSGTTYETVPLVAGSNSLQISCGTASPANAIANSAFQIWIAAEPLSVLRCIQFNFGLGGGYFNFDTEETTAGGCYIQAVETREVDGLIWKRLQCRRTDLAPGGIGSTMNIYTTRDFTSNSPAISAGERPNAKMYFAEPQMIGDVALPFGPDLKMSAHYNASATASLGVTRGEQWQYKHPYVDQESHMGGGSYPGGLNLKIVKPPGWTKTGNYPVLVLLPALSDAAEGSNKNAWQAATIDDYASLYNCVVVVPYDRSENYWWGSWSTGYQNTSDFLALALMPWLIKYMGVSPNRNDHLVLGYSKSGNAAVSQILRYPTVWGFAGSWDGAFSNVYPDNAASSGYDTSGQYALYDPAQILTSNLSSVNDAKRLVIRGGMAWGSHYTSFVNQLNTNSVPNDSSYNTESIHAWGPTGTNGSWTPSLVSKMFEQRAKLLNSGSYMMFLAM